MVQKDNLLSPREQEILQLLWEGLTTRDIAHMLHRSVTVTIHRKHILEKLDVRTTAAVFRITLARHWSRLLLLYLP